MATKIEWTDETWNPVTGCTKVSAGCANCYAERMARRLAGRYGYPEAPHHFDVTLHPERLEQPLRWRKPRRVFVCSMGDLFHEDVPYSWVEDILRIALWTPQHTYQILTKRPERMRVAYRTFCQTFNEGYPTKPLPNVWLGVSCENQDAADARIPPLLQTPAAVRFVSAEPLLGAIDLGLVNEHGGPADFARINGLHWLIVGGESGPGARPMHPDWARGLRDQAQTAGVPFFFKQHGAWIKQRAVPGDDWSQVVFMDELGKTHKPTNGLEFWRVGKKRAGRLLDGREWNEMPAAGAS